MSKISISGGSNRWTSHLNAGLSFHFSQEISDFDSPWESAQTGTRLSISTVAALSKLCHWDHLKANMYSQKGHFRLNNNWVVFNAWLHVPGAQTCRWICKSVNRSHTRHWDDKGYVNLLGEGIQGLPLLGWTKKKTWPEEEVGRVGGYCIWQKSHDPNCCVTMTPDSIPSI